MRKLFILLLTLLCVTGVARGQDETVTGYDCECLIDGVSVKHATMPPDGGQARWQIDAAAAAAFASPTIPVFILYALAAPSLK